MGYYLKSFGRLSVRLHLVHSAIFLIRPVSYRVFIIISPPHGQRNFCVVTVVREFFDAAIIASRYYRFASIVKRKDFVKHLINIKKPIFHIAHYKIILRPQPYMLIFPFIIMDNAISDAPYPRRRGEVVHTKPPCVRYLVLL